jgi:hypothetical protein
MITRVLPHAEFIVALAQLRVVSHAPLALRFRFSLGYSSCLRRACSTMPSHICHTSEHAMHDATPLRAPTSQLHLLLRDAVQVPALS